MIKGKETIDSENSDKNRELVWTYIERAAILEGSVHEEVKRGRRRKLITNNVVTVCCTTATLVV